MLRYSAQVKTRHHADGVIGWASCVDGSIGWASPSLPQAGLKAVGVSAKDAWGGRPFPSLVADREKECRWLVVLDEGWGGCLVDINNFGVTKCFHILLRNDLGGSIWKVFFVSVDFFWSMLIGQPSCDRDACGWFYCIPRHFACGSDHERILLAAVAERSLFQSE